MAGMYGCFRRRNSDGAAMASGPPDVMTNQEPAEAAEECSGKKKSKFQTFKKFFARKKRKEPPAAGADAGLKASQSSDNVSKTSENNTLTRSEKDKGSASKISLGSKALSHDSVFVSDSSEANEALGASQDSIHGKVKSLQLQLKQAIKLGSPPSLMCVKRTEDAGAMSEDDGLPCSPPEYTTPHTVMNQAQRTSSISLEGIESDDDQLSCAASSRAVSPLVVPGDFSQPASPFGCLDNSAAKHKLGLRHKACNKRKPISRLELKAEADSVDGETLNTSITEVLEEKEQQETTEVVSVDELEPKVVREEEEDEEEEVKDEEEEEGEEEEEEEEEEEQPQPSRRSLLRDEEEREEAEDEPEAEQDVPCDPDTSSPPELCPSEEEAADAQPPSSSKPSSRTSSLDRPGATPESPAGHREYLLDPPGIAFGAEESRAECDLVLREEDVVQEHSEEESSFLQEVLSSLKTPLASSLGVETESNVVEIDEELKEKQKEDVKVEEGVEVKEEEAQEDELASHEIAPVDSLLSDKTSEENEDVATLSTNTPSCQDDEEEEKVEDTEEATEEEEELAVEHFSPLDQKEEGETEEAEEEKPEEQNDLLTGSTVNQAEEEESEGEEEAIDLEKEPEVEEEGQEKKEEDDEEMEVMEEKERVEEADEAIEEERDDAEEMTEVLPDAGAEEVKITVTLEAADEGVDVVVGDDALYPSQQTNNDNIPTDLDDQEFAIMHESQTTTSESFGEEKEDGEYMVEENVEISHPEHKSDQEEDDEVKQPDADQTERDVVQEGEEIKPVEKDHIEATEQAQGSSKPPTLPLTESHYETQPKESGSITPSKTSTTTLHINLLSPSSEKAKSFFQPSPTDAHPKVSDITAAEQNTASTEEETADTMETAEEEEKQSILEEAPPPASVEETANQPTRGSDQSRARFTIAPAWQRSISVEDAKERLTPPSSPPACVSSPSPAITGPGGDEVEAATKKEPEVKAEPASPAKVEVVLSPGRGRNAGTTAPKPQSHVTLSPSSMKPQTSAAASTEESSVAVEGKTDNPFGVRLRKTSTMRRFSSEEENTEHPVEPPAQPTSSKVHSPQPVSVKPSISQPISNKPALPKKPDVHGESAAKNKRISDPAAARAASGGSGSPSWISVAKQKQKIYKENSLEEITVKKEEQERKSSLPMYVSSAVNREHSHRTAENTSKVSPLEISKPPVSVEKEARRPFSPPTAPSQPSKSQSPPCPIPPKPQVPPAATKPLHPNPPQRSLSPPTPVPVPQKPPSCTSPPSLSKPAASSKTPQPQSTTVTSPPFSSRTAPEKSQRGLPPPVLPQDEPPWMALAKKKAKAWSEMPQIVQ